MNGTVKKIACDGLFLLVAIALIFISWHICAAADGSSFVVPSIDDTVRAFRFVFGKRYFWNGIVGTMKRSAIGYGVSLALFFAIYSLSCAFKSFARTVEPIVSLLRSLPAVALTLVLLLAVGGDGTPIILGAVVIFPILYSAAKARTATVSTELKEICVLLGASRAATVKSLWLPTLAGGLPESLSSAFSYNVKAVIGAEILSQAASSLGVLMSSAQTNLRQDILVALVITAVVISVVCEFAIRLALKLVLARYLD